jgi:hypothetical protein
MQKGRTRTFLVAIFGAAGALGCNPNAASVTNATNDEPVTPTARTVDADWTPAQLAPSAWYFASASDFVVAKDGSARWVDRSGNEHDAVQSSPAATPELAENGWFGAPSLHFDGARLMTVSAWSGAPAGATASYSVLAVMRASTLGQSASIASFWDPQGGGFAWAGLRGNDGVTLPELTRTHALADSQFFAGPHDLGTEPHVVVWRYGSSTQTIDVTVDGVTSSSAALAPIEHLPAMPLIVGAKSLLPTGGFVGDLSELVVVGRTLSDSEVQDFTAYARSTWPHLPQAGSPDPCRLADGSASPESMRCDDGNELTYGDHCSAGICVGALPHAGSPAELSPLAWYHAGASEVGVTDGCVSTWFDRTASHADLTQGFYFSRPTFDTHGWDDASTPALKFAGHQLLRRAQWTNLLGDGDGAYTLFAVLRSNQAQNAAFSWTSGAAALPSLGRGRHVAIWQYSQDAVKLTLDGRTTVTPRESPRKNVPADEVLVGSEQKVAHEMFDGELAELALIPGALSDAQVAGLGRYAEDEWGGLEL